MLTQLSVQTRSKSLYRIETITHINALQEEKKEICVALKINQATT